MAQDNLSIHVDDDWKAQARAEKERLAQKAASATSAKPAAAPIGASGGAPSQTPESAAAKQERKASFAMMVSTMATQSLLAMGVIPDPRSGQRMQAFDVARYHIDTLAILEAKTKGNLTQEETDMLAVTLYDLRSRYVQMVTAARTV